MDFALLRKVSTTLLQEFEMRTVLAAFTAVVVAACATTDSTAPSADAAFSKGSSGTTTASALGAIRVKCELRSGSGARSVISVDGNNLRPLNGKFSARVSSGANNASAPLQTAIGDEAEFDFNSQPNDIAAGAVAIPATFISVNAAGPDVQASILDANGALVVSGGADCRVR